MALPAVSPPIKRIARGAGLQDGNGVATPQHKGAGANRLPIGRMMRTEQGVAPQGASLRNHQGEKGNCYVKRTTLEAGWHVCVGDRIPPEAQAGIRSSVSYRATSSASIPFRKRLRRAGIAQWTERRMRLCRVHMARVEGLAKLMKARQGQGDR